MSNLRVHVNALGAVMGGATRHLPPFLHAMHEVRPEWSIRVWVTSGLLSSKIPDDVSIEAVPHWGHMRRLWWESVELPRLLRRDHANVLLNLTNSGPIRSPVPSVMYQRNALWFDPAWVSRLHGRQRVIATARRQLAYLQMRASRATIVPSGAMEKFLGRWRGAPRGAVIVPIPHGVDMQRFGFSQRSWPPASNERIRLLCVGHAAPYKNQLFVVCLVAHLLAAGVDAELWLTVDRRDSPAYFDELCRTRRELKVEDRVVLLGRVDAVEDLYLKAHALIFPSISESFGFPLLEAMASGLPVLASRIPATEELLSSYGWLFAPDDLTSAASAMTEILTSSAVQTTTRVAAVRARGLSWTNNAARVAAVIEEAL